MKPRILIDTHILLWALILDPRLTQQASTLLTRADLVVVSAATLWEIRIKAQLGKLKIPDHLNTKSLAQRGYHLLSISPEHAFHVRRLPLHHRDPFDRMLVAQAQCEELTLVSQDQKLADYEVDVMLV